MMDETPHVTSPRGQVWSAKQAMNRGCLSRCRCLDRYRTQPPASSGGDAARNRDRLSQRCDGRAIGRRRSPSHYEDMRLRALVAFLGCLAVLTGAVNAAAAMQAVVADHRSAIGTPCTDCDDCNKQPCPMAMTDCIQMHAGSGLALLSEEGDLGRARYIVLPWSLVHSTRSGLSPPPDPFPPRS